LSAVSSGRSPSELLTAVLGVISIAETPAVLQALNPAYALQFVLTHPSGLWY
jgi:K+ transporter